MYGRYSESDKKGQGERQMFIWDFVADTVLGQITDWVYGQIVGFLGSFFAQMGNMGADLFEMEWVQAIVMFFSCLAGLCM